MSDSNKFLSALVLIAVVILVYVNWDKISSLWKTTTTSNGTPCSINLGTGGAMNMPGTYQNGICVPNSVIPKDGTPCTTKDNKDGTIVGGACIANVNPTPRPQQNANTVKITNPNGARILSIQGNNFVSLANAPVIPVNTILTITQWIPSPKIYYKTTQGWVDGNDATVVS